MNKKPTRFPRSGIGVQALVPINQAPALVPLKADEARALARCEQTIRDGLQTFVEVGLALAEISARRLYKATHTTFEAYCEEVWDFTGRRGRQLIDSAKVVKLIEKASPRARTIVPATESQARPLTRLPEVEVPPAWREAVKAGGGAPTAREVEAVVQGREVVAPIAPAAPESPYLEAQRVAADLMPRYRRLGKLVIEDKLCRVKYAEGLELLQDIERRLVELLTVKPRKPSKRRKSHIGPAARARLSALARERWAKIKAAGVAPETNQAKTNGALREAIISSRVRAAAKGQAL